VGGDAIAVRSAAWLETSVEQVVRAGDHNIVVLRVLDLELDPDLAPLVFHGSGFRRLHPGDTPVDGARNLY
jgi:flavin reductase (DIM6/NTAB) family NADH-FMN oxidoreductase RutF